MYDYHKAVTYVCSSGLKFEGYYSFQGGAIFSYFAWYQAWQRDIKLDYAGMCLFADTRSLQKVQVLYIVQFFPR
jgi:hypothetical protein